MGEETDTCDLEGEVIETSNIRPTYEQVSNIISKLF